ncbi:MAG: cytidylate kinase family protein [Candidatus Methylumidiphilus sp.]
MLNIITISGDIGGGKSAVAKSLEQTLGYAVIGTGSIQREIAKKRGLTTLELNQLSITDKSIDDEIDGFVVALGKTRRDIIIDSRLAWHFIPEAFKAFLTVDPLIGAQRVYGDQRAEEQNPTLAKTLANNLQRQALETERFKKLYGVDLRDFRNYAAVIDTSHSPPVAIAAKLAELYQAALRGENFPRLWLNARRLTPTKDYTPDNLDALRETLRSQGFNPAEPLSVALQAGHIYLLADHRRALAAHLEGLDLLPCRIETDYSPPSAATPWPWQTDA